MTSGLTSSVAARTGAATAAAVFKTVVVTRDSTPAPQEDSPGSGGATVAAAEAAQEEEGPGEEGPGEEDLLCTREAVDTGEADEAGLGAARHPSRRPLHQED